MPQSFAMLLAETLPWRDQLVLTREITVPVEREEFFRRVRRGEFTALRRGVYLRTDAWAAMRPAEQYRWRVLASAAYSREPLTFSHLSAAALWKLPLIGQMPTRVHALGGIAAGGTSTTVVIRHLDSVFDDIQAIQGVSVTSLARTVVDIARVCPFTVAVPVVDAALRLTALPREDVPPTSVTTAALLHELSLVPIRQGTARAQRAIEFGDARADRPGESVSRANIHLSGLTAPELQVQLRGASGRAYFVDFWWPMFNVIGEFDGQAKYEEAEFLRGRSPQQALADEKFREDDLRAAGHGMSRWGWQTAMNQRRLRDHVMKLGVR